MKHWLNRSLLAAGLWFLPHQALAQTDVGITAAGLVSIQPVDDTYVGSPYLNEGIGGTTFGINAGVTAILPSGFVLGGEYSTAWYEQMQDGRLVLGPFPLEHVSASTKMHDSLLNILAGYATHGTSRVV